MEKIGVILPSRGLIFAQVEDALQSNLQGYNYHVYRSWDLQIPDCQNMLVEQALRDGCGMFLFVEEDTVMPEGGFKRLLEAKADIACIDYGVSGYSCITKDKKTNEILWCGLGCTLVQRYVLDRLEKPYFRTDQALLLNHWPEVHWINPGKQAYGGQDIYFGMQARAAGFYIQQVAGECQHLQLVDVGRKEINNGLHLIKQKPMISHYQTL